LEETERIKTFIQKEFGGGNIESFDDENKSIIFYLIDSTSKTL
jgi:hypothetical protein